MPLTDTHATAVQFIIWLSGEVSKYVTRHALIYDRQPGSTVWPIGNVHFLFRSEKNHEQKEVKNGAARMRTSVE